MTIKIGPWLERLCTAPGENGGRLIQLMPPDGGKPWDTWEIDPERDVKEQCAEIAKAADEVTKSLQPELPKKRHVFLLEVCTASGRFLGRQPISITGTSVDNNFHATATDAVTGAMVALMQLWKESLSVSGQATRDANEECNRLRAELSKKYDHEIGEKKDLVEHLSSAVGSENMEKLVDLLVKQAPVALEVAQAYIEMQKK